MKKNLNPENPSAAVIIHARVAAMSAIKPTAEMLSLLF